MTGPTHAITGLAAAVLVGRVTGVMPDGPALLALLCGVLAPDVDGTGVITKPGTVLRRFLGRTLGEVVDMIFGLAVGVVHLFFRHRGFIHSPLIAASILGLAMAFEIVWLEWFGIGYAVHLLGDACTRGGIPMLAPFSSNMHSLCSMKTGSRAEAIFAVGLLLLVIASGWGLLPESVQSVHAEIFDKLRGSQVEAD